MTGTGEKEIRFMADAMLGKLAKWLRVLGYDTWYAACFDPAMTNRAMDEGRYFLTRHEKRAGLYSNSLLIHGDGVEDQLSELVEMISLTQERSHWFSRCLRCNTLLVKVESEGDLDRVPDYVNYTRKAEIKFCSSCERYYWPGSHRTRMIARLENSGFVRKKRKRPLGSH